MHQIVITNSGGSRISQRGGPQPLRCAPTYYLTNFSWNLHETEESLTTGKACLVPPRSATVIQLLVIVNKAVLMPSFIQHQKAAVSGTKMQSNFKRTKNAKKKKTIFHFGKRVFGWETQQLNESRFWRTKNAAFIGTGQAFRLHYKFYIWTSKLWSLK